MTAAAFITFGLAVGFPYYNLPFFTDYFQKEYGGREPTSRWAFRWRRSSRFG